MSESLAVMDGNFQALAVHRAPEEVLEEARKAARALTTVIEGKKKKVVFNGETYLENEDWLTVARFYGVTSRIRSTNYIEYGDVRGFEATAEAFMLGPNGGEVISTSEAMCLNDEPNWAKKPLFQLRSMAQTRASSRVLRQVFGWVVVLAGYKATPAEEMDGQAVHSQPRGRQQSAGRKTAPVGDTMCGECRQVNGHHPLCKYFKGTAPAAAQAAPAEATPVQPQETTTQAVEPPQKPGNTKMAVKINSVSERSKVKDGNKQIYLVLGVVDPNNNEWDLYVWHKTLQERAATLTNRSALIEFSQKTSNGRTYCSLEAILEVVGEQTLEPDDDF
jgi:hypothetical protein